MSNTKELIPIKDCIKGRVYILECRNLRLGVFDGTDGFIGIRNKFGRDFLATEFHWDQGPPFGTVSGTLDTGVTVPSTIIIAEYLGTIDRDTGRVVEWDPEAQNPNPNHKDRKGWYKFKDGEVCSDYSKISVTTQNNELLFTFLEEQEKELLK